MRRGHRSANRRPGDPGWRAGVPAVAARRGPDRGDPRSSLGRKSRADRSRPGDEGDAGAGRAGRGVRRVRSDHRGKRDGQGSSRAPSPPAVQTGRAAVRRAELRRHPGGAAGERTVRGTRRAPSPALRHAALEKFEAADGGTLLLDEISEMDVRPSGASCCARCRSGRSIVWVARPRCGSMCASSRRRTAISRPRWGGGPFGRICGFG